MPLRLFCILVCVALCIAALWGGAYALHAVHVSDYVGDFGGSYVWHWADVPIVITTIAAIVLFGLVASVFGEDL
jgi:hypothetical protein